MGAASAVPRPVSAAPSFSAAAACAAASSAAAASVAAARLRMSPFCCGAVLSAAAMPSGAARTRLRGRAERRPNPAPPAPRRSLQHSQVAPASWSQLRAIEYENSGSSIEEHRRERGRKVSQLRGPGLHSSQYCVSVRECLSRSLRIYTRATPTNKFGPQPGTPCARRVDSLGICYNVPSPTFTVCLTGAPPKTNSRGHVFIPKASRGN